MRVGVLGGMFDPIHFGHLAAAEAAQKALALQSIILVPSSIPPHRAQPARAGAEHRLAMAELAAAGRPGWSVSRIEIDREGPSYTFDTLVELRKRGAAMIGSAREKNAPAVESQFFFITGADAFAEIATWSRYPAVLDLANFVVVSRPGITLDSLREKVPWAFERPSSSLTRVILVEAHTPDVSSTEIRQRVRAGQSLSGLVPDAVAAYISAHRLYVQEPHGSMAQN
jgi:nicotinate-nucleotide adenylyltransferase